MVEARCGNAAIAYLADRGAISYHPPSSVISATKPGAPAPRPLPRCELVDHLRHGAGDAGGVAAAGEVA